jgi:hypothetical protein
MPAANCRAGTRRFVRHCEHNVADRHRSVVAHLQQRVTRPQLVDLEAFPLSPNTDSGDAPCCRSELRSRMKEIASEARSYNLPQVPSTQVRALSKSCCHGEHSPHSRGCHESCTVRNTRSGCGIMTVTRPSAFVRPAMPWGEPFGLAG